MHTQKAIDMHTYIHRLICVSFVFTSSSAFGNYFIVQSHRPSDQPIAHTCIKISYTSSSIRSNMCMMRKPLLLCATIIFIIMHVCMRAICICMCSVYTMDSRRFKHNYYTTCCLLMSSLHLLIHVHACRSMCVCV